MKSVKAFAPATVANMVCGYDILGFAVNEPGDTVELILNDSGVVTLDHISGDGGLLPKDAQKNIASAVVMQYLSGIGKSQGVSVKLYKGMPLNSGMGSSSASSVAALLAINHLMGEPLSRVQLLPFAMEGERLACGSAHADNVAPALLGGLVLVRSSNPVDPIKLPVPEGLFCTLVHPHVDVPTSESRRILKERIAVRDAITQWGNVAGMVAGFCTNNKALIGRSMEDIIFEPIRAMLIPQFYEMKQKALELGALGFGISGSGPTIFALTEDKLVAEKIAKALPDILSVNNTHADSHVCTINTTGAAIL